MAKGVALAWDLIARDAGASTTFARVAASADKAAASTARAEKGILGFSKRAAAGLGALASIDFAVHAVKDAAEFESAMNRIHTVVGASTQEVQRMSTAILGLSGQVAQSPEHLAVSLYHMEAIGLRGAKALDAVKAAAMGAKIGNADLEETTNALTATIQSGIAGNQSFAKTMSQLLTIVGTGDMKLQDFNEALGSGLLAVMANAGVSLRDVGAALAVFGDNNIRGADAATMLRVAVQAMQAPAKGGAKALASIGLQSDALKKDLLRGGLNAAIADLNKHLDASGNSGKKAGALIVEAFGKKANTGIGVLIHEFDLLQTKYGIIDKNTNNFADKWKATTKTAQFALDRLRAEFEVVAITVGTKLIPPVTAFVNFLTQKVGPNLVAPWHALEEVLSVVGTAFGAIAHVAGALHLPIAQIGIAAAGAYVGFKLFSLVPVLLNSVGIAAKGALLLVNDLAVGAVASGSAIAEGGVVARVGWAGILGPLGAAAVGIGLLVSMFHRSGNASKEAAAAAKAYTEALSGDGGKSTLIDTITSQLKDNNVPKKIDELNAALGRGTFTGNEFAAAIEAGGKPLATLKARLQGVIDTDRARISQMVSGMTVGQRANLDTNKSYQVLNGQLKTASSLLGDVTAQSVGLSKAVKKDLLDTKTFAGVSSSIDKVSQSTTVGSDTAKQYAAMMGIVVNKNGVAAVSSKTLQAAVSTVSNAYNDATTAGMGYLDAVKSFSTTAGTAADRAALIGATLKAANGDALSFAGAMIGTTSAVNTMVDAFKQQKDQLAQQSADAQNAAEGETKAQRSLGDAHSRVAAAQARLNAVRANGKSTAAQLASAESALRSANSGAANAADRLRTAQSSAGKAGALAYSDTERAAIRFKKTSDGLAASINTNAKGAGDLVGQLQGMQTAAMAAAGAMFQHEVSTKGATKAADDAYNIYKTKTLGSLEAQATALGLNKTQADALATAYFGMPKSVKTLIEQEGANPVVDVLNRIGQLLANLTGQQWDVKVNFKATNSAILQTAGFGAGVKGKTTKAQDPRLGGSAGAGSPGRVINIQNQNITVNYPERGDVKEGLAQAMRGARLALSR